MQGDFGVIGRPRDAVVWLPPPNGDGCSVDDWANLRRGRGTEIAGQPGDGGGLGCGGLQRKDW